MRKVNNELMKRLCIPVSPSGKNSAIAIYQVKDDGHRKLSVVLNIDYVDTHITISIREESFGYLESDNKEFAVAQVYVILQMMKTLLLELTGNEFNCDDAIFYGDKLISKLSDVDTSMIFIDRHFDTFYFYDEVYSQYYGHQLWARRMRDGGVDRFNRGSLRSFQPNIIQQMISHGTLNR